MASKAHTLYPAQPDSDEAISPKLCSNMLLMLAHATTRKEKL